MVRNNLQLVHFQLKYNKIIPAARYNIFGSMNITFGYFEFTGLGSRILANSSPLACTGPLGITT